MSSQNNRLTSIIRPACLLTLIFLVTPTSSVAEGDAGVKPRKAAINPNTVLPVPQVIVEGTVLYAEQNAPPDVQIPAEDIVSYAQSFPPAAEPALVDLLSLLSGGGSPPFIMAGGMSGRSWAFSSSVDRGAIGFLASCGGYEDLPIIFTSPVVLDVSGGASPDQITAAATPHPYSLDTTRTAVFDIDGDGYVDLTEWVNADLALLVVPASPECIFELERLWTCPQPISGRDLVGTVAGYRSGFERLLAFDADHNLRIAGQELAPFYLWVDVNGDAVANTGELFKPEDLNVTELVVPESGSEGSFVRGDTTTDAMWDWWPTFAPLRPNPGRKSGAKVTYWESVELQGALEEVGPADLIVTVDRTVSRGQEFLLIDNLTAHGFNARESLLACLDPAGVHVAYVDYRLEAPHTARIWIIHRGTGATWHVHRFPIPEADIGQVAFDGAGGQVLVMARGLSQTYIVTGWDAGDGSVSHIAWQDGGFRGCWGAAFADRGGGTPVSRRYYVPGYFHLPNGNPVCDSVALLEVNGASATMTPVSDIHALRGAYLPGLGTGLEAAFSHFLKSPDLSFALAQNSELTTSLVAIHAGAPGDWQAEEIDRAAAVAGLSASGTRVEYLAQRDGGQWEICWADVSGGGRKSPGVSLAYPGRPSYAELADAGTKPLWMDFGWSTGTASLFMFDATAHHPAVIPLLGDIPIPGPVRVAEAAPVYAAQTESGLVVGQANVFYGLNVPVLGGVGLAVLLVACGILGGSAVTRSKR
jgi:hypothetical protein